MCQLAEGSLRWLFVVAMAEASPFMDVLINAVLSCALIGLYL